MKMMSAIQPLSRDEAPSQARSEKDQVNLGPFEKAPSFVMHIARLTAFDRFFEHFDTANLRISEFTVLLAVAENPGVRQGVIANVLKIKWSAMTKLVRELEERGLVRRHVPASDRRAVELQVTEEGRRVIDGQADHMFACDEAALDMLDEAEKAELLRLTRKISGWPALDEVTP